MRIAFLVAFLLFVPSCLQGQNTGLKGRALDVNGAVIPGLPIVVEANKGKKIEATTNEDGEYSLALPFGRYSIRFGGGNTLWCVVEIWSYPVPKFNGYVNFDITVEGHSDHGNDRCRKVILKF
jgi:hypothetical protein